LTPAPSKYSSLFDSSSNQIYQPIWLQLEPNIQPNIPALSTPVQSNYSSPFDSTSNLISTPV
jgi:hypothetical protein